MKINLIGGDAYSSTGGIQGMNRLLVRELSAMGMLGKAHFLWDNTSNSSEEGRELQEKGLVKFYGLRRSQFITDLLGSGLRFSREFWLCTHVNYAALGLTASGGRFARVGVLLHAAELDEQFSLLKRAALRCAGFVISVSEYTKKKAVRLGVNPSRVRVLPNGIDDPCTGWILPVTPPPAQITLLFVGRMDERYKGQMELLDATALLRKRLPSLRTVFVGGGRTLSEWKAEAERRNLTDVVDFTGRVSDAQLHEAYRTATLFVMPSENEGFGLVYAEAMAHGLPCIGSDRDAAREVIEHGKTGMCVPAGNATALADAICELIKFPAKRAGMSTAGRARFLENFTVQRYRERLAMTMQIWESAL